MPKAAVDVEDLIAQATVAHAAETAAMQAKLDQQEEAARKQAAAVAAMMARCELVSILRLLHLVPESWGLPIGASLIRSLKKSTVAGAANGSKVVRIKMRGG